MRIEQAKRSCTVYFDSLDDLASVAEENRAICRATSDPAWIGCTPEQAATYARKGWESELPDALRLAESAVEKVEKEYEFPAFLPVYDVAGCEVDVARFLDDEPECMIDYPLTPIVKAGRVITLCASVAFSAAVSTRSILRRGQAVVALALALQDLGYAVEIWTDWTDKGVSRAAQTLSIRTLVKGPHDVLDAARLMFALAHPAMCRALTFAAAHAAPASYRRSAGIGAHYGYPTDPDRNLPDGTIYLPSVRSSRDIPDLDTALIGYLRELEIVTD